jgi:homocitrate synthase NifV
MALRVAAGVDCGVDTQHLTGLCRLVAAAAGESIPRRQPIVGRAAFEHESGVHVHAMQRDRRRKSAEPAHASSWENTPGRRPYDVRWPNVGYK